MRSSVARIRSSSLTRDWTQVSFTGAQSSSHWTTQEVPHEKYFKLKLLNLENSNQRLLFPSRDYQTYMHHLPVWQFFFKKKMEILLVCKYFLLIHHSTFLAIYYFQIMQKRKKKDHLLHLLMNESLIFIIAIQKVKKIKTVNELLSTKYAIRTYYTSQGI